MSNVFQFDAPKKNDTAFMLCNCKPDDPQPFMVVAIVGDAPIICQLVCPECEKTHDVVNGIVSHE